jgi:hypothetical protein
MNESAWNTFSKEEAEHMTRVTGGAIKVEKIIKMPLLDINDVMAKHFGKAPTYVSIDAEGQHLLRKSSLNTGDAPLCLPSLLVVALLGSCPLL